MIAKYNACLPVHTITLCISSHVRLAGDSDETDDDEALDCQLSSDVDSETSEAEEEMVVDDDQEPVKNKSSVT